MKILCLSGWGQKFDSLEMIFQDQVFDPFFVSSVNYAKCDSTEKFFAEIDKENPEIVIGWSLGGQLAIRAIEKGIIAPKLLILLAPPFQMIKDSRIQAAMPQDVFDEFYKNFSAAPTKTLKEFSILTAMNDRNAGEIARNLDIDDKNFLQLKFWLEELQRFSCFDIDFTNMPRTLYFHGAGDMITHLSHSELFQQKIKNLRLEIFKNCGHAPHLSDLARLQEIILEEIKSIPEQNQTSAL